MIARAHLSANLPLRKSLGVSATLVGYTYLPFAFFPFVTVFNFGPDIQPYAVILATVFVLLQFGTPLPSCLLWLLIPFLASLLLALVDELSFFSLRSVASYWSLFAHAATAYLIATQRPDLIKRWVYIAMGLWMLFALAQLTFGTGFVQVIIPNLSWDVDRGVTSLATEPSFYAITCIFLLLLARAVSDRFDPILSLLLAFQIIFLAKSPLGILLFVIVVLSQLVFHLSLIRLVAFSSVLIGAMYLAIAYGTAEVRAVSLIHELFYEPSSLYYVDVSINARLNHLIYSVRGFLENFGVPYGFNQFHSYVLRLLDSEASIVWLGVIPHDLKIMSGYGGALFELGWFGLVIPVAVTVCIWRRFRNDLPSFWAFALPLNAILFSALQLALPLVGIVAGVCAAGKREGGSTFVRRVSRQKGAAAGAA